MKAQFRLNSIGAYATCMCAAATCNCNCTCGCQCLPNPSSWAGSTLSAPGGQSNSAQISNNSAVAASNQNRLYGG
jgi:hypothetical protein